jgi:hypothetical protein
MSGIAGPARPERAPSFQQGLSALREVADGGK